MTGTKHLIVMRHAKSSWKTNEPDQRRPLSSRGTRDAVVAGQHLARLELDVVWCSAAVRAEQTWQSAQMGDARCADVRIEQALYDADADELLATLRTTPAQASAVLLIGHEPAVSDLVLSLALPSPLTARISEKFPTSGLAVLAHPLEWSELAPGTANLLAFNVPRG